MSHDTNDLADTELFRLIRAYAAIRDRDIRARFLYAAEAWAHDQFEMEVCEHF